MNAFLAGISESALFVAVVAIWLVCICTPRKAVTNQDEDYQ